MYIKFFLAPLMGGIIGYITNDLAIKMLFRPRKPVYIGKWHIPFTPGLIPRQKERIAASVGRVVSTQLLDAETVSRTILSKKTLQGMEGKIRSFLEQYQEDGRTVQQVLEQYMEPGKIDNYKAVIREQGTKFLMEKLQQEEVGKKIVQCGMDALREKMKGQMRLFGNFLDEAVLKNVEKALGNMVNETISEKAPELLDEEIGKLEDDFLEMALADIYDSQKEYVPQLAQKTVELYKSVIENNLDKLLAAIDVEAIVQEKIASFDAVQLEQMIFGIMKKELRAIVYLGALLGFFMGFINLLF